MKPDTPSMDELIDLYQQAQHDHTARTRLNEILRNHPTSRQQLSAFLVDEELLCEELQTEQIDQVLSHESVIPFSETTQPKPSKWWVIGGMAAALIIGSTITYQLTKTSPVNTPTHITKKTNPSRSRKTILDCSPEAIVPNSHMEDHWIQQRQSHQARYTRARKRHSLHCFLKRC